MNNSDLKGYLESIALRNEDGRIGYEEIVESAKPESSPIHCYFNWDNDEAGHAWRLQQAAVLVRRVKFTLVRDEGTPKEVHYTVRAFESLPSFRRKGNGSYVTVDSIMNNEEWKKEHLSSILNGIESYRKKYSQYQELKGIWREVDKARSKLSQKSRKQKPEDRPSA